MAQVWNRKGIACTECCHASTAPDIHCHSETLSNPACFSIHSLLLGRTKTTKCWLCFDCLQIWFVPFVLLHSPRLWVMPTANNKQNIYLCGNKMPTRCNRLYLSQILLHAQHVSDNTMPIIRSSRVLYRWSLPVVFGALVFRLSVWCGAGGYMSGLQAAAFHIITTMHGQNHFKWCLFLVLMLCTDELFWNFSWFPMKKLINEYMYWLSESIYRLSYHGPL